MSEPRYISPMLDGFTLGQSISDHNGVECFPAIHNDSEKRYIVKKISLPASQVQVDALLLTNVYHSADAVRAYYAELAQDLCREARALNTLAEQRGFVPFQAQQIEPMQMGVGYEVYLISRYRKTLERHMRRNPMTHLGAVNLGIDLCAAMAVCREAGWLYVDLKPENIYIFGDQEYRIGDLGLVAMDSLKYASLPDRYRSIYTAPEVSDAYSSLNATMDTYALGLILYQVYNDGKLPFSGEDGRRAWLDKLAAGEPIAAPAYADQEMAGIITKACALDPSQRWQTPAEMGHALISYMQRNGAEDLPIIPPAEPEPDPVPVEEPDPVSMEDSGQTEVPGSDSGEQEPTADKSESAAGSDEIPAEQSDATDSDNAVQTEEAMDHQDPEEVPVEQANKTPADWIELMDTILSEDGGQDGHDGEDPVSLRQLLSDNDLQADAPEIDAERVTAETADILNFAQELIEHEAPAPLVAPEPIDIPIPEPLPIETEEETDEETAIQPEADEEIVLTLDEDPADTPAAETTFLSTADVEKKPGLWKKILGTAAALAAAAAIAFGIWFFYQNYYLQAIDSMVCSGTATQVTVTVTTEMDQSKLTVICKDTYGNAVPGKLENGTVTFSDLVPGSQYIISLEPEGLHKLVGSTSVTYSTPAETKFTHLSAVTGQEAGSAIISFGVDGRDSEEWTLSYAHGGENQSITFSGHTVTVSGLTVGENYTFTLSAPEEIILVGETTITHTASDLVCAAGLNLSDYQNGTITVSWTAPADVNVERWIVRCFDGNGYDQLMEVSTTSASFAGITDGGKYTVEVIASGMTLGVRTEITADTSSITGFIAAANGSTIELSWNYAGAVPEGGWTIAWSADGGPEQIFLSQENKATFSPVAPGSSYLFTIVPPEGSSLSEATAAVDTPEAGAFSANKLDASSILVEMHDIPTKTGWNHVTLQNAREKDTFKSGTGLALLYTVTKPYNFDSAVFESVFVIRDAEGKLVGISSHARVWDKMWDNGYCTETISALPTAAGAYTLSIYIENGLLAELPFTIE